MKVKYSVSSLKEYDEELHEKVKQHVLDLLQKDEFDCEYAKIDKEIFVTIKLLKN